MTRAAEPTTNPAAPAFAVRVRPKFREVVLPPGAVSRVRATPGREDAAAPDRDDPDRPA